MKYPGYAREVNAILDVARAAELAHELFPDVSATDIIGNLQEAGGEWAWSLIEIIMDYEKRERRGEERLESRGAASTGGQFRMVPRVTREQGERFADECAKLTNFDVTIDDVFAETAIVEWPTAPDLQERYRELRREIVTEALSVARQALAEAFVQVANEAIERERRDS